MYCSVSTPYDLSNRSLIKIIVETNAEISSVKLAIPDPEGQEIVGKRSFAIQKQMCFIITAKSGRRYSRKRVVNCHVEVILALGTQPLVCCILMTRCRRGDWSAMEESISTLAFLDKHDAFHLMRCIERDLHSIYSMEL